MIPNQSQRLNIDVSKYVEQKAKGTVRIVLINGVHHYSMRRFDQETGEAIPVLIRIAIESVQAERDRLTAVIAALDA
ncbi:MAG TPA: hypothetical protein VII92_07690, partial [Anaerolineae bacterium]